MRLNEELDAQDGQPLQIQTTTGGFNMNIIPGEMLEEMQLRVNGRRNELHQKFNDNDSRHNDFDGFDDQLEFNDS